MYKVVFHIDEMEKWDLLLANLENLINGFDEEIIVKVVANSVAVNYLNSTSNLKQKVEKLEELTKRKIEFLACENALKGQNINKENLFEFVQTTPAGVVELTKLQHDGFSYIKP